MVKETKNEKNNLLTLLRENNFTYMSTSDLFAKRMVVNDIYLMTIGNMVTGN